ncbi:hypothetical protein SLS62_007444 [Diatrype stigma]|uniref:Uncharacterized protein n=1 Tax=Diatrype stigma TaxID=117547 RepID=A0AAN9UPN5_9PEZI
MPLPQFPAATHNSPRTWFITSSLSPLAVRLIRLLLAHGDYVVAALPPAEVEREDRSAEFRELVNECKASGRRDREGWRDRIRSIRCDGRSMGQCEAAVAEAKEHFGRIDILLCCTSEAVVGTVEELSTTPATRDLVRDQFETIFFSQVNYIKAALPVLREQHTGHILVLTSIGGHIGTPGMPMYTAATWALEGFCDSLAYEIAPFNVKVTVVQPHKEIQSLTNRLVFAPALSPYSYQYQNHPYHHQQGGGGGGTDSPPSPSSGVGGPAGASSMAAPAPTVRDMLTHVLNLHPETALPPQAPTQPSPSPPPGSDQYQQLGSEEVSNPAAASAASSTILERYARLPPAAADRLVMETVYALTAIGGHENPPARHIVGFEGAEAVKEKLKTVTEELEDFVDASLAVDIFETELKDEARLGGFGGSGGGGDGGGNDSNNAGGGDGSGSNNDNKSRTAGTTTAVTVGLDEIMVDVGDGSGSGGDGGGPPSTASM